MGMMKNKQSLALVLPVIVGLFGWFSPSQANAEMMVRFNTTMGSFVVELFDTAAPQTVANFLNYVNDGDYTDSIIHRSVPGFVIQGGGFTTDGSDVVQRIPTDAPVANEFNQFNLRGTIAMAQLGGNPNSSTNQWFINLSDNSGLDADDFTVFGRVVQGLDTVVDGIAALPRANFPGITSNIDQVEFGDATIEAAFNEAPVFDYTQDNFDNDEPITVDNLVFVSSVEVTMPEPASLAILTLGCCLMLRRRVA